MPSPSPIKTFIQLKQIQLGILNIIVKTHDISTTAKIAKKMEKLAKELENMKIDPESVFADKEIQAQAYNAIVSFDSHSLAIAFRTECLELVAGLKKSLPKRVDSINSYEQSLLPDTITTATLEQYMSALYKLTWDNLPVFFSEDYTPFFEYIIRGCNDFIDVRDRLYLLKWFAHPKCADETKQFFKQRIMFMAALAFAHYLMPPQAIVAGQEILRSRGQQWVHDTIESLVNGLASADPSTLEHIITLLKEFTEKPELMEVIRRTSDIFRNSTIAALIPQLLKTIPTEKWGFDLSVVVDAFRQMGSQVSP